MLLLSVFRLFFKQGTVQIGRLLLVTCTKTLTNKGDMIFSSVTTDVSKSYYRTVPDLTRHVPLVLRYGQLRAVPPPTRCTSHVPHNSPQDPAKSGAVLHHVQNRRPPRRPTMTRIIHGSGRLRHALCGGATSFFSFLPSPDFTRPFVTLR